MNVDVAVVPAAGRGTRMRPATRMVPKALLPLVDRPALQWVLEEAVAAGRRRPHHQPFRGYGWTGSHHRVEGY
jgi:UTP-glucose-1-phosphate uridylyltransferase